MPNSNSDSQVFSKVMTTLARDAANEVGGVSLAKDSRLKKAVQVSFLPNQKVQIDLTIGIASGVSVPSKVAELQECVKREIESTTKFKVNAVNVAISCVTNEQAI